MPPLVLDTNVVLDAFLFADPRTAPLVQALEADAVDWIATQVMRDELERVLAYAHVVKLLAARSMAPEDVLARYDRHVTLVDVAAKAPLTCGDADDQKFIDLALAHRALLVSKDREVLKMRKRMEKLGCPGCVAIYPGVIPDSIRDPSWRAGMDAGSSPE